MNDPVTKYAMENIIVNCSALILLVLLRMQHKSVKNSFLLDQKLFAFMLDLAIVQCFFEAFTNLCDKEQFMFCREINMIVNLVYFTLNIVFAFVWSIYAIYKIYGSMNRVKRYVRIIGGPAVLALLLVWTTPITGWVFTISENNYYTRGPIFMVPALAVIAYLVFGIIYIYSNRKRTSKYMIMPIFLIMLPIFIGMAVQGLLPGVAIIAMVIAIALVGIYASTQTESAYIDRLSGVYNRRYLDDYLTSLSEDDKNKKRKKTITGIMLDMDKFKAINDNFGHHVGDDAIAQVGVILRENLGKLNFAARYGGDEFIIITPMLDRESIEELMEKLTNAANEKNASGEYEYVLQFSYGYAQFTVGKEESYDGFMKRMDDNMYNYKVAKKARLAKEEAKLEAQKKAAEAEKEAVVQ